MNKPLSQLSYTELRKMERKAQPPIRDGVRGELFNRTLRDMYTNRKVFIETGFEIPHFKAPVRW